MLYDAHTHLNDEAIFPQWESLVQEFISKGGRGLVNAGARSDFNTNGLLIAQEAKKKFPQVFIKATLGYHPEECSAQGEITQENYLQKMQALKEECIVQKDDVVAIGECGIDLHFPGAPESLDLQKKLFALHCELAQELNLPIIVHSRDGFAPTLEVLQNYPEIKVYFHCRGYGPEEVETLKRLSVETGRKLFIGFCGNITYKNAQPLRDTLDIVPIDQIVLETDAPRLSPQAVRGTTNTPANVKYIYDFVAELKGVPVQELSAQIQENFYALYTL